MKLKYVISDWGRIPRGVAWLTGLWLAAAVLYAGPEDSAAEPGHLFRMGFSPNILVGFNENDANAAVKTWVRTLAEERHIQVDPNPEVFTSLPAMVKSWQGQKVDIVTMTLPEYWSIREDLKFNRFISATRTGGEFMETYLLLVRKDSSWQTAADLKGRSLLVLESPAMSLAQPWLDTILLESNLEPASQYFGRITTNTKLAKVVLPVFFRQADACLVSQSGFAILGEMNPQIFEQLKPLATSPALLPSGGFFNAATPAAAVDRMIEQLKQVHTSPAGQQLLTVFQAERVEERPLTCMQGALDLLARHEELLKAYRTHANNASPAAPAIAEPLAPPQTARK
ncbi:MAG TPA: PhnD/SsuA/transferrin family substrate-binding protein [Dongiaceae bacterium]|jgi:phosphonate transport system substrate-binding protein|nr:PhnD/SsuA/transferrin family substrate-binding protein [Dongiaceae bacterium]